MILTFPIFRKTFPKRRPKTIRYCQTNQKPTRNNKKLQKEPRNFRQSDVFFDQIKLAPDIFIGTKITSLAEFLWKINLDIQSKIKIEEKNFFFCSFISDKHTKKIMTIENELDD